MRKIALALLLSLVMMGSVAAQDSCGNALPPRLEVSQQGLVDTRDGFYLNLRTSPGLNGEEILRLAPGELFDVLDGPRCVDGFYWWHIKQFKLTGWIAESAGRDYMVEPFDRAALPPLPPLPTTSGTTTPDWMRLIDNVFDNLLAVLKP